jgi:two-component SAPR family response regulator
MQVLGPLSTLDTALALLDQEKDLAGAVLDIRVRGAAVYPLAEALQRRSVPFMFVSGYQREDLPDAFRHIQYLAKPVAAGQVTRALQSMLALVVGATAQMPGEN